MESMTESNDDIVQTADNKSVDSNLWRDVCQASAWLDRAQKIYEDITTSKADPKEVIECAKKALSLYQECFATVKKRVSNKTILKPMHKELPVEKIREDSAFNIGWQLIKDVDVCLIIYGLVSIVVPFVLKVGFDL